MIHLVEQLIIKYIYYRNMGDLFSNLKVTVSPLDQCFSNIKVHISHQGAFLNADS